MGKITNKLVAEVFKQYPPAARKKLLNLRQLILDTSAGSEAIGSIEETLKWGEPAYLAKKGSTVRLGWKQATPEQCAIYFQCQTSLVETFREVYKDQLTFQGNRAILFDLNQPIPEDAVAHCIELSLNYHRIKHLPMLGV